MLDLSLFWIYEEYLVNCSLRSPEYGTCVKTMDVHAKIVNEIHVPDKLNPRLPHRGGEAPVGYN